MSVSNAITIANDESLSGLIRSAMHRLVVLAPAVSRPVAEAIVDRWKSLNRESVSVILDVDAEVYRLGYGDVEALHVLEKAAARLGVMVNRHAGIRVGMVIADDQTLVYSPTPQLVEAGPCNPDAPNAIRLGPPPAKVVEELGEGPRGVKDRRIGQDKATNAEVAAVAADLKRNPPQKFDIARTMRVFNSLVEFVEFELSGANVERHKASLPAELMGLTANGPTRDLIDAQFRLIAKDSKISGAALHDKKNEIMAEFLTTLPKYGHVILRAKKEEFEQRIEAFRKELQAFAKDVQANLDHEMKQNRARIIEALLPLVRRSPPVAWKKQSVDSLHDDQLRLLLDRALSKAFGDAAKHVRAMHVRLVFKGVTFESLTDPDFIELALERLPALTQLHTEMQAARAESPTERRH